MEVFLSQTEVNTLQWDPLIGFELTAKRHPATTSHMAYPLGHTASFRHLI